jgi:hypothetical protein
MGASPPSITPGAGSARVARREKVEKSFHPSVLGHRRGGHKECAAGVAPRGVQNSLEGRAPAALLEAGPKAPTIVDFIEMSAGRAPSFCCEFRALRVPRCRRRDLGPARLGPARLGPARLGPARLGPARLGRPARPLQLALLPRPLRSLCPFLTRRSLSSSPLQAHGMPQSRAPFNCARSVQFRGLRSISRRWASFGLLFAAPCGPWRANSARRGSSLSTIAHSGPKAKDAGPEPGTSRPSRSWTLRGSGSPALAAPSGSRRWSGSPTKCRGRLSTRAR